MIWLLYYTLISIVIGSAVAVLAVYLDLKGATRWPAAIGYGALAAVVWPVVLALGLLL